jgi:hypothetical protein
MTLLRSLLAINVGLLLLATIPAFAQKGRDNPLEYRFEYDYNFRVGIDAGFLSAWQAGTFDVGCGHFTAGAGFNPVIALSIDHPLSRNLFVEGLVGYKGSSVVSTYNSLENVALQTDKGVIKFVDVDFENKGNASFGYAFIMPSLKYFIFKGLFVGLGASADLLISKQVQYTKTIISKSVTVPDLGQAEVSYPEQESSDPYARVFPAETPNNASGFVLDGAAYVGAEFTLSGKWRLLPRLLYTVPFGQALTAPDDLKISTLQFLVGVRYEIR